MIETSYAELSTLAGRDLGRSSWFAIEQPRISGFADATEDHQWIHVDTERASIVHGGAIAHGFLTLSLLPRLSAELLNIRDMGQMINCGSNRVRFINMVKAGMRIRLHQRVLAIEPRPLGQQLISECTVELEGQERPACIAETIMLILPAFGSEAVAA